MSTFVKTPIDKQNNLYRIENAVDPNLIENFNNEDVSLYPVEESPGHQRWPRKKIIPYEGSTLSEIKRQLTKNAKCDDVVFWLDSEGFTMGPHIDNKNVKVAMQIYIGNANSDLGTVFYHVDNSDVIMITKPDGSRDWFLKRTTELETRYNFKYIPNTGYYCVNGKLQAHGLEKTVGPNDFRVSAYCYFY